MTYQREAVQSPGSDGDASRLTGLQALNAATLQARLENLTAALDAARSANDAQRALALTLQTHAIELELQGRLLRDTQHALEVSRDHYARLFYDAPVGYVVLDRDGVIQTTNLTAASLLGQPRTQLVGCAFERIVSGAQISDFYAHLDAVFDTPATAPTVCVLFVHLCETARARVFRLCSIQRDGLLGPECLTVLFDITSEHELEQQRLADDRLRESVLDALPAQIAVLDQDGRILTANRAWRTRSDEQNASDDLREALGLNAIAACRWRGERPSRGVLVAARGIEDVIERKRSDFSIEHACDTVRGRRWFLMRVLSLEGPSKGAVVAYLDITERHIGEEQARRARGALARVDRLNAVGILASSLIHELLQPLSSASFYCSAAKQLAEGPAADPKRLVDVLHRIDAQVRRAGDIMERLRAFLRGRAMNKVPIALEQVLKRAFELVLWFAADHRVELQLHAPEHIPPIQGDPVQIEQILVNVICNAIQAIDVGDCAQRDVSLEVVRGSNEIEVIVRDTGPGLPPGRHETIFDIFESINDSGLGLGLPISRAIAEAHGGRLWAEPSSSTGAVFHLTLPIMTDKK